MRLPLPLVLAVTVITSAAAQVRGSRSRSCDLTERLSLLLPMTLADGNELGQRPMRQRTSRPSTTFRACGVGAAAECQTSGEYGQRRAHLEPKSR